MKWFEIVLEIDRGGELDDEPEWEKLSKADFEPRQSDLFPDRDKDYEMVGHFDGYDVALPHKSRDAVMYVLFRGSRAVAYISLDYYMHAENDVQVKAISIDPTARGKNLAPRFYRWLLTDGHIDRLYADDQQTDGGARIWDRLLGQPGIGVFIARVDPDAPQDGRRVKTLRGLTKVWQSNTYTLYAQAL